MSGCGQYLDTNYGGRVILCVFLEALLMDGVTHTKTHSSSGPLTQRLMTVSYWTVEL